MKDSQECMGSELLLEVTFDQILAHTVSSRVGNDGLLHGDADTMLSESYDGTPALYFNNRAGILPAHEYVDFGNIPTDGDDFSIQLWIRTSRDGCNGWSARATWVEPEGVIDVSSFDEKQRTHGGVLLANAPFGDPGHRGIVLACMQQYLSFMTSVNTGEGHEPVQVSGMKKAADDRWHQITVVCARSGTEKIYLDASLEEEADLSAFAGLSLDGGNFILGADADGMLGLGEAAVGELRIYRGLLNPEQIDGRYYASAVLGLVHEFEKTDFSRDERFGMEAVQALRFEAEDVRRKALLLRGRADGGGCLQEAKNLYEAFRSRYESFLQGENRPVFRFMLFSDAHVEGEGGERQQALKSAMEWAGELGMDAYVDAGDYSNFGEDEERDAYWNVVTALRGTMKPLVSLGNHETYKRPGKEIKAYHLRKLKEAGMIPEDHDEFYFEYEIEGYHFLILSQYNDRYEIPGRHGKWVTNGCTEIDEKQFDWVEERLGRYCGKGKPVFLVIHNAVREVLNEQSQGDYPEWQVIQNGDRFYEMWSRFPDIVLITGHVHHGLGDCCGVCRTAAGYHVIDVPAFCGSPKGYGHSKFTRMLPKHGGYFVSVYPKGIYLRAVDFVSREWLTAYDQTIRIPAGGE